MSDELGPFHDHASNVDQGSLTESIVPILAEMIQRGTLAARRPMSGLGPGCVKTPMPNLYVEVFSRLR
jgi:hypothetical protein